MFRQKYIEEIEETELYWNNQLYLRLKGKPSLSDMVNVLKGYVLSSLVELPREISHLSQNPDYRVGITVEELQADYEEVKNVKKDIEEFELSNI